MFQASWDGYKIQVTRLIEEQGVDVNEFCEHPTDDEFRSAALKNAAKRGQLELVKQLVLQQCADVNKGNVNLWTPLMQACQEGHVEIVHFLIEHGANVNLCTIFHHTALMANAWAGNSTITNLLVKTSSKAQEDWMALHFAATYGHADVAMCLIQHGAEINIKECDRFTPLLLTISDNHVTAADVLLEHRADPNIPKSSELYPLHVAVSKGYSHLATAVINGGADINAKDLKGRTALMVAAETGNTVCSIVLLRKGANINACDSHGRTTLMAAVLNSRLEAV